MQPTDYASTPAPAPKLDPAPAPKLDSAPVLPTMREARTFPLSTSVGPFVAVAGLYEMRRDFGYLVDSAPFDRDRVPPTVRGRQVAHALGLLLFRGPCAQCVTPAEYARRHAAGEIPDAGTPAYEKLRAEDRLPRVMRRPEGGPCFHEFTSKAGNLWRTDSDRFAARRWTTAAAGSIYSAVADALERLTDREVDRARHAATLDVAGDALDRAARERAQAEAAFGAARIEHQQADRALRQALTAADRAGFRFAPEGDSVS